jgi:hypothetical protein
MKYASAAVFSPHRLLAFVADGGFVSMARASIVLSSPPALHLILAFASTADLGELLASCKAAQFPGLREYMHTRHVANLDLRLFISEIHEGRLLDNQASLRADANRLEVENARLVVFSNRLLMRRVPCAECGVVFPLTHAIELGETGRYMHPTCFLEGGASDSA